MASCFGLKAFGARLGRLLGMKEKTHHRRSITISAPYNFVHETGASLPGVSDDEVAILREKAAASCMGGGPAAHNPPSSRRAPIPPPSASSGGSRSPPPPVNGANMF